MKKILPIVLVVAGLLVFGFIFFKSQKSSPVTPAGTTTPAVNLPINTIPVASRPFFTLTPDASGHNLTLQISQMTDKMIMDYELVYNTGEIQEGAFGRIDFTKDAQPIIKTILLGTRSAGGATTYHENVTGGSLTATYGTTRLKESFNFLRFSSSVLDYNSPDGKFVVTLGEKAFKAGAIILLMKTFGLPASLPESTPTLLAGPYTFQTATSPKGVVTVSLSLPEGGEHSSAVLYEWTGSVWKKLPGKTTATAITASVVSGSTFLLAE